MNCISSVGIISVWLPGQERFLPKCTAWIPHATVKGMSQQKNEVPLRVAQCSRVHCSSFLRRGGVRMAIFSLLGGANHTNLYKNLIKIWIYSANLGMIGGPGPCPPPCLRPCFYGDKYMHSIGQKHHIVLKYVQILLSKICTNFATANHGQTGQEISNRVLLLGSFTPIMD